MDQWVEILPQGRLGIAAYRLQTGGTHGLERHSFRSKGWRREGLDTENRKERRGQSTLTDDDNSLEAISMQEGVSQRRN